MLRFSNIKKGVWEITLKKWIYTIYSAWGYGNGTKRREQTAQLLIVQYIQCNPGPSQVLLMLEHKQSLSLAAQSQLFFTELPVRISIFWADGGRGCLALMAVHPDGWCQSDTEAQSHLKSLGGECESRAVLIVTVDLTLFWQPALI